MGLSDFIILASIITGLTSIPFLTSSITSDYTPTGNIIFDIGNSSTPSQLSRSLTSDKFQEVYQTPFGKLKIIIEPDKIYQELSRPDRRTTVTQMPEKTTWKLTSQKYTLTVVNEGYRTIDEFATPEGYLKKIKETGNTTEIFRGPSNIEDLYNEAKEILEDDVERINEVMENHMNIGKEERYDVSINELLPYPDNDFNHDNETNSDDEFIELYNYGDSTVDLSNWTISDEGGSILKIPVGTHLNPGEIAFFIKGDKDGDYGNEWEGSWPFLNNGGDEIKLFDEDENEVDSFSYSTSTRGKSWSRIPDGTGDFQENSPTPGSLNS